MGPKETDPLLVVNQGTSLTVSSFSSTPAFKKNQKSVRCRGPTIIAMVFVALAAGLLILIPMFQTSHQAASDSSEPLAEISENGEYVVHYPLNATTTTTFGELSEIMLPSWFEASILAVEHALQPDVMDPSNVQSARKVLLTTRDLLDVFAPVYPPKSRWKKLRSYYKKGYEAVGYYQDLDHAHVKYSKELWDDRRNVVLAWKAGFLAFSQRPSVRRLLTSGASSTGCYYHHKESHLFWDDEQLDTPCAKDLATPTLQTLASIQLNNALDYLDLVSTYDSVLELSREEDFHNLRKVIRSFQDEYDLFGFVVLPDVSNSTAEDNLQTLSESRTLLGDINDHWTAYHIYETNNEHMDQQKTLALKIDKEWKKFKEWAAANDLAGAIQALLDEMQS